MEEDPTHGRVATAETGQQLVDVVDHKLVSQDTVLQMICG